MHSRLTYGKPERRDVASFGTRGFTLIELAVGIFIITLLLGSLLVPLTTQVTQRKISDTQKNLEEIKEALIGFAITNGRLPCPAQSPTNGMEKAPPCNAAVDRVGYIPWTTLGVSQLDAWGHIVRYSVTPAYSSAAPQFTLSTSGDITINTRNSAGAITTLTNANIPAVIMSHGQNGYGAVSNQGAAAALPAGWLLSFADEYTNATTGAGTTFVSRTYQDTGATGTGGEFDDIVVWLSPNILFNRMVAAGRLPR